MNHKKQSIACVYPGSTIPAPPGEGDHTQPEDHGKPPLPGAKKCVLLVDDDESILEAGRQVLQHFGFAVMTAQNGEDAVRLYQDRFPAIDVVILDLNMPGMGGDDCLREIMIIDPTSKVIMSSGTAPKHLLKRFRRDGAQHFLGKPYHVNDLIKTIRSAIRSEQRRPRRCRVKPIIQNPIAQ